MQFLVPLNISENSYPLLYPFSSKMKPFSTFLIFVSVLLVACSLSTATRPEPDSTSGFFSPQSAKKDKPSDQDKNGGGMGGFFGPGSGFGIPGWGNNGGIGGGYGAGYGGPSGGYSKGGIVRPTVVCKDKGPCYQKKLTCPAKCFTSYSRSGKGYGGGGGGGGCTMDCKKKCVAYC